MPQTRKKVILTWTTREWNFFSVEIRIWLPYWSSYPYVSPINHTDDSWEPRMSFRFKIPHYFIHFIPY